MLGVVPSGALSLGLDIVATSGREARTGDAWIFTPRFPLPPGIELAIIGRETRYDGWQELARIRVPAAEFAPTASIVRIDPDVETVPANLLRFSVSFSTPMDEGTAAGHIHLLDQDGADVEGALLEMPPELWDRDRRRLTVLLEPGRIKRGLQPNVQAGAPLRAGEVVTLVVDADIRDGAGSPLVDGARRSYRVEPALRTRIDPRSWDLSWPESMGEPLEIRFDRALDATLAGRHIRVETPDGVAVPGRVDVTARTWTFTSEADSANWRIRVDTRLEDLAGNSVRRVFDRDLESPMDDSIEAGTIILSRGGEWMLGAD